MELMSVGFLTALVGLLTGVVLRLVAWLGDFMHARCNRIRDSGGLKFGYGMACAGPGGWWRGFSRNDIWPFVTLYT